MTVNAESKEEAATKLKGIMTEETMKQHFAQKHVGQEMPTLEQAHMMIEQNTQGIMAPAA